MSFIVAFFLFQYAWNKADSISENLWRNLGKKIRIKEQWPIARQEWESSATIHKQNDRKGQNSQCLH